MTPPRARFSSSFGFLMVASGSAIGLGNIWGFPTQAANNGGAAFVIAYLVLAFLLAFPALMAELVIGRHSHANIVNALGGLSHSARINRLGAILGCVGVATASLILSFYAIVAGWMLARLLEAVAVILGWDAGASWARTASPWRDLVLCALFSLWTCWIVRQGINRGIEAWSKKLMPLLLFILLALIGYVFTQPGATTGLRVYLVPDFSHLTDANLLLSAMGQSFFSLSLGVGTMLIYGSYLGQTLSSTQRITGDQRDHLPRLGATVTLMDSGFSFLAGLLVVPALYVAHQNGVAIIAEDGKLMGGPGVVMQVLPSLFATMGAVGNWVAAGFFALLCIAAITSSISMLEVPVSVVTEKTRIARPLAAPLISLLVFAVSTLIIFNFNRLFDLVVSITTRFSEPLMGLVMCLFAGWILHRDSRLRRLREQGAQGQGWFWRIWPFYVRFLCPLFIVLMLLQNLR